MGSVGEVVGMSWTARGLGAESSEACSPLLSLSELCQQEVILSWDADHGQELCPLDDS